MSTLAIKNQRHSFQKTAFIYLIIAIFCVVFTTIYEQFSYGEHSLLMRRMFLFPLIGGTFLFLFLSFMKKNISIPPISRNLYHSAIALFTNGCLVTGIITISGRFTDYDTIYWTLGSCFLFVSIVYCFLSNLRIARKSKR